ncbi:hypothetical protein X751_00080 [Mesorhizobium sp. LNJC395A00]|nr:hypothetical protein X751_00080 [Mesorhizobium sp. LNJC395A00]
MAETMVSRDTLSIELPIIASDAILSSLKYKSPAFDMLWKSSSVSLASIFFFSMYTPIASQNSTYLFSLSVL